MPYLLGLLLIVGSTTSAMAERGLLWHEQRFPGGVVQLLASVPAEPQWLYGIAADTVDRNLSRSLIRSRDGGASWERLAYVGSRLRVTALAVDSVDPERVYTAFKNQQEHALLISGDGGRTWQKITLPGHEPPHELTPLISALVPVPLVEGGLYLATLGQGVFFSDDGGLNWQPRNLDGIHVIELAVDPDDGGIVYANTGDAQFASLDGGHSWDRIHQAENARMAVDPDGILYLSESRDGTAGRLLSSDDRGRSWQTLSSQAPAGIQHLHPASHDRRVLHAMTQSGLWSSTDGGRGWTNRTPQLSGASERLLGRYWQKHSPDSPYQLTTSAYAYPALGPLVSTSADGALYLPFRGGVAVSTDDGNHWQLRSDGLGGIGGTFVFDRNNPWTAYASTDGGFHRSRDGGLSWQRLDQGLPDFSADQLLSIPGRPGLLLARDARGIWRSTDGGERWQRLELPASVTVGELLHGGENPSVIYGVGYTRLLRSGDGGAQWEVIDLDAESGGPGRILSLAVDQVDGDLLYAVSTASCHLFIGCTPGPVFRSLDGGLSWTGIGYVEADEVYKPRQLVPMPGRSGALHQLTSARDQRLYRSDDAGSNWQRLSDPPFRADAIVPHPWQADVLYAVGIDREHGAEDRPPSTTLRVSRSDDGGFTWQTAIERHRLEQLGFADLQINPAYPSLQLNTRRSLLHLLEDYPLVWWDPARSGQGLSLRADGDAIWGSWTHYDDSGRARWLLLGGTLRNNVLETELHAYRGPAPGGDWDPARVVSRPVGSVRIDFSQPFGPRFDYDLPEAGGTLDLEPFRPQADGPLSGIWWDPQQAGQGVTLSQQDGRLWGYWYHYDTSGESAWLLFQGELLDHELGTTLYRYRGPMLSDWNPDRLSSEPVGRVMLTRSGNEELRFDYRLDAGAQGSLTLRPF